MFCTNGISSYFVFSENHYTENYGYEIKEDSKYKGGHRNENDCKIFIQSGGKDMPSPVSLRRNNQGIWKLFEFSSLYTGVKPDHDQRDF